MLYARSSKKEPFIGSVKIMFNFGGLQSEFSSLEGAAFVIAPVPYDLTSTYQPGSRRGPSAIIEASTNMELYDEELCQETFRSGIHTLEALEIDARGPKEMIGRVRDMISGIVAKGKMPVMLGGEHSISFGAVQAVMEKYPELTVVQFDAHADLRDSYQGSPFSHASVARRISEIADLVQVGIRSMSAEEAAFLDQRGAQKGIRTYSADFVHNEPDCKERVCKNIKSDVYITIDLDALDPAVMPSTGTPEPGGLSWWDLLGTIREISRRSSIRGFDVVELSPIPGLVAPDFLASKLIYRIMGYISEKGR